MANVLSRTGTWMTAAVIAVALFMYWLYAESSSIERGTFVADTAAAVDVVSDSAFASNPQQFSRRRIVVRDVKVSEVLGRAALTVDLPGRPGYPVILERTVVDQQLELVTGDNLALGGWVYALNDSILTVWVQRGLFEPEGREKMAGDSTFLLVDSLDFVIPGQE